jgi:hypothetical protein
MLLLSDSNLFICSQVMNMSGFSGDQRLCADEKEQKIRVVEMYR